MRRLSLELWGGLGDPAAIQVNEPQLLNYAMDEELIQVPTAQM